MAEVPVKQEQEELSDELLHPKKKVKFSSENDEPETEEGAEQGEESEEVPSQANSEGNEKKKLIDQLVNEFGDDEEEIQVVIGPVAGSNSGAAKTDKTGTDQTGTAPAAGSASTKPKEALPAFRFSGSSLTSGLWQELTPEMEEALRVTGVNTRNYARRMSEMNSKRISALEDDLDEIEFPKWREPGAVQSDFFNYGLNEQTWREWGARQVALRIYRTMKMHESAHQSIAQPVNPDALYDARHES